MADQDELVARMLVAGRELSNAAVMFHTALAEHQGLTATEEKTLDLLERLGTLTARQLSEHSGLAPASVTGLIDRLERKGFARRVRNPEDRRSVLVEAVPDRLAALAPLFDDYVVSLKELAARYDERELAAIVDFLGEAAARQKQATRRLVED
ncbi:MarR family transcriptional regulator [Nonomuraea sp. MG754425]|uniref:MarR family winged helix-turn-helix transcriptional regulator n=1 Tax=Nonomuraea sp. MG754425 TaxID=2570319 RepID=UPI001F01089E|nr:MarR family transcriptional regulator [Nonomuraea sp. MG754425]MCF6475667.1 MarR family transcriptional regulator [Nonomuraea sp. MG754425]